MRPVAFMWRHFTNDKASPDGCVWRFGLPDELKPPAVLIPVYTRP